MTARFLSALSFQRVLLSIVIPFSLVGLWQIASSVGSLNSFILPSPFSVAKALTELLHSGELLQHLGASLARVIAGFAISAVTATALGLLVGISTTWNRLLSSTLHFLRPIPPIAWIPLSILWFGLGNGPSLSLTMIASFFPILLNTWAGVESIHPHHIDVARTLGCSRWAMLKDVIWPASLPSILTGYRIGFGFAWMAVMAAEMVATPSGIGYFIQVSQNMLRADHVIAGMFAIGCVGLFFDVLFLRLRRRLVRWSLRSEHE